MARHNIAAAAADHGITIEKTGGLKRNLIATCAKCGTQSEPLSLPPNAALDWMLNRFKERGWDMHKKACCPTCTHPPKPKQEHQPVPRNNIVTLPTRQITPEDRLKIRELLDGHYDERRKCLLDGQTDQSLAALIDVPWSWVRDLREAAYGPIEIDREQLKLQTDIAALRDEVAASKAKALACEAALVALEARFEKWSAR